MLNMKMTISSCMFIEFTIDVSEVNVEFYFHRLKGKGGFSLEKGGEKDGMLQNILNYVLQK